MSDLPLSWRIKPLGEVVDPQRPITYGIVQAGRHIENGIPYIRVSDMTKGYLTLDGMLRTSEEIARSYKRSMVLTNDLVFALRGSPGLVLKVPPDLNGANLTQGTARIAPNDTVVTDYLLQALQSQVVQTDIMLRVKGSTFQEISLKELGKVRVPIPPLPEQRKIAEILSTWDEAIQLTGQLIAALGRRKQALMQLLLTGEVRFPEFEGEWEEVRLRDIFERVQRPITTSIEKILSITATVGFVDQSEKFGRVIAGKNLEKYIRLLRGEFSYNKGNSKSYPQGCIYRLEDFEEGAVPNVYYSFRTSREYAIGEFYKYYFESGALNSQLRQVIKTGVRNDGLLNLAVDDFFDVVVPLPPKEEQKSIALLLDYATMEINLLESYLQELQTQKRGLMQQLLTGQVRVNAAGG